MMEKLSVLFSIMGVLGLLFISNSIGYAHVNISEINSSLIGKRISFEGNITSIREYKTLQVLTVSSLQDSSEIEVVVFDDIEIGDEIVSIKGEVVEYGEGIEVQAAEIRLKKK